MTKTFHSPAAKNAPLYFLLFLSGLLLLSCNVQKRRYQKGYYVDWKKEKKQETVQRQSATGKNAHKQSSEQVVSLPQPAAPLLAEAGANKRGAATLKPVKTSALLQQCDEIIFKDGTELKAVVTEVTETEVKYKKCDNPDGPLYVARVGDVFMIKYSHGLRRVFGESKAPEKQSAQPPQEKKVHTMAILSAIFGAFGIFYGITSIPAIILGAIALRDIRRNPDKYSGRGLAIAGLVMGIVVVAIFLLVILILIAFLI